MPVGYTSKNHYSVARYKQRPLGKNPDEIDFEIRNENFNSWVDDKEFCSWLGKFLKAFHSPSKDYTK